MYALKFQKQNHTRVSNKITTMPFSFYQNVEFQKKQPAMFFWTQQEFGRRSSSNKKRSVSALKKRMKRY